MIGWSLSPTILPGSRFDTNCSVVMPNALASETKLSPFTSATGLVSNWAILPLLSKVLFDRSSWDHPSLFRKAFTFLPKSMSIYSCGCYGFLLARIHFNDAQLFALVGQCANINA